MTSLELIDQTINSLQEQFNSALIRMTSVTDDVLRKQLCDEASDLEYNISLLKIERSQLEDVIFKTMVDDSFDEMFAFYKKQFLPSSIDDELHISSLVKKYKMREISSLTQRRELLLLMKADDASLEICDMCGCIYDIIGDGKKIYTVYVEGFSSIEKTIQLDKILKKK